MYEISRFLLYPLNKLGIRYLRNFCLCGFDCLLKFVGKSIRSLDCSCILLCLCLVSWFLLNLRLDYTCTCLCNRFRIDLCELLCRRKGERGSRVGCSRPGFGRNTGYLSNQRFSGSGLQCPEFIFHRLSSTSRTATIPARPPAFGKCLIIGLGSFENTLLVEVGKSHAKKASGIRGRILEC